MLQKNLLQAVLVLGMLLQVSPAPLRGVQLGLAGLVPAPLTGGLVPLEPLLQADLNGDGQPEVLLLQQYRLEILSAGLPAWQNPPGWRVVQAQITDLNRDGRPEAALLVWRPFRPWPVDRWLPYGGRIAGFHDKQGNSCQIILIGWRGDEYGELWAGSALAEPVRSFAAADLNGDGFQELVTLDGRYADPRTAPGRKLKVWEWNGFGFSVVYGMDGTFYHLALARLAAGSILILVP
jgi:hypothetical protein